MEKKILNNKVLRCSLALVLCVSIALPFYLNHESSAIAESEQVKLIVGDQIEYAGYSTCHVTDEETGYALICAQPSKKTPKEGSYKKDYKWENNVDGPDYSNCETDEEKATVLWLYENRLAMIERVFYFGHPDSPGFDKSFWPSKWYDKSTISKKQYIALTHVVLSDLYSNDLKTATYGCNSEFKSWLAEEVTGGYSKGDGKVTQDSRKNSVYGKMYHSRTNKDWSVPDEFKIYRVSTGSEHQDMFGIEASGYLCLTKSSANAALTNGNSCYSLAGAKYGIYKNEECTKKIAELKTNASGYAKSDALDVGTYYIKEISAPASYVLNSNVIKVNVTCGTTTSAQESKTSEVPKIVTLQYLMKKVDKESLVGSPLGGASLEGAKFELKYYCNTSGNTSGAATYSWIFKTDKEGIINFQNPDNYLVSGSKMFKASDGTYGLPIGTYTLQEIEAPSGYILNKEVFTQTIKASGTTEKINSWNIYSVPDQIKRGDISFNKKNGETGEHMANTVFKLTSKTTGESHIIVTDENGYFSSESSWNAHSNNTNSNDAALSEDGTSIDESKLDANAGIWFGQQSGEQYCEVNDELCALPFDTYMLEELPCAANDGMNLVKDDNISISRDGVAINFGTIDNNPSDDPTQPQEPQDETPSAEDPPAEDTPEPQQETNDDEPENKIVKKQSPEKTATAKETGSVKTGEADYIAWILMLAGTSFAALCICLICKKRARRKTTNTRTPKNQALTSFKKMHNPN